MGALVGTVAYSLGLTVAIMYVHAIHREDHSSGEEVSGYPLR